jgi:hypothetical protein
MDQTRQSQFWRLVVVDFGYLMREKLLTTTSTELLNVGTWKYRRKKIHAPYRYCPVPQPLEALAIAAKASP